MGLRLEEEYFEWLRSIVDPDNQTDQYDLLLTKLYNTEFRWNKPMDENRAIDGIELRRRFINDNYDSRYLLKMENRPCSVLEMMVALAIRCEQDIMQDPLEGDRTALWFWIMVDNLRLGCMTDSEFNKAYADAILNDFLDGNYKRNGIGSIFFARNYSKDFRRLDLWMQMNVFLRENY